LELSKDSEGEYKCDFEAETWKVAWSDHHQDWCCKNVGCPTTTVPYDCEDGLLKSAIEWTAEKRNWCCFTANLGCHSLPPDAETTFDCFVDWAEPGWAPKMIDWCCKNKKQGCPGAVTTTQPAKVGSFVCTTGLDRWETGWSNEKKDWCCQHQALGCTTTLPGTVTITTVTFTSNTFTTTTLATLPYACHVSLNEADAAWSDAKRDWCCKNEKLGCHYDCKQGADNWRKLWPADQQGWCCQKVFVGCVQQYDCLTGLEHWQTRWTKHQKGWCCLHRGLGCPGDAEPNATATSGPKKAPAFDCNRRGKWTNEQRAWCCANEGRCKVGGVEIYYSTGWSWENRWSRQPPALVSFAAATMLTVLVTLLVLGGCRARRRTPQTRAVDAWHVPLQQGTVGPAA